MKGPRYAGNLSRKPRLSSLSTYTSSRLSGLTRTGGKYTLQRPKGPEEEEEEEESLFRADAVRRRLRRRMLVLTMEAARILESRQSRCGLPAGL